MLKPFIIPVTLAASLVLVLASFTSQAKLMAQETESRSQLSQLSQLQRDFEEPIQILAENDFLDLAANVYRATGNVRINQGTLRITADELEVTGFEERDGEVELFILRGTPATYQQEIEPGVLVEAQAHLIEYNATERTLTLSTLAELRQDGSLVRANRISYNIELQQVISESGDGTEQVETILRPRQRQSQNQNGNENGN
ncbi:lipopolysaccharide transport periplasmic protein LptA [Aliidiomarina haloalkalitolerans]|uniref:Lipopolysaccharide transport periplasmic protein LptA n=1 Tax=Aliidiomarina haloalkalitolerans TaxID=859059 RepID=A0A432VSN9_9GAMM|nr:lipopolysaccharide transport periplasmic protein LptA [Aliidiomarina haloalkalitolerans]RUO19451.1 lipopolysaccharide transport periplasmic protein LptA [Aliidiomarina haloalkalitolerans]